MGAVREQKVPQGQHLGQRRGAGAHGQHGRKGVDLGLDAAREQAVRQLRVHDRQTPVYQPDALVHPVHRPAHVSGAARRDEAVEGGVCFGLRSRRVQEWRAQHVHPLHVDPGLRTPGFGGAAAAAICTGEDPGTDPAAGALLQVRPDWVGVLEFGAAEIGGGVGQSSGVGVGGGGWWGLTFLFRVVQGPGYGVEEADEGVVRDAALEERIGLEGAESVVADFGVGGRGAASGEGEIGVGGDWGRVEQDQPDVDA